MSKDIKQQLDDVESKLDEHTRILASIDKTLALQAQQLELHIKRTDIAEANLKLLRDEFKPVQAHVNFINGLSKLVVLIGVIAGIVHVVWQIVTK